MTMNRRDVLTLAAHLVEDTKRNAEVIKAANIKIG
jgi:hypothetical protein